MEEKISWPKVPYLTIEEAIVRGIEKEDFSQSEVSIAQEYLKIKEELEAAVDSRQAVQNQIWELGNVDESDEKYKVLLEKFHLEDEHVESLFGLSRSMEEMPLMRKVMDYAKTLCEEERKRKSDEEMLEYRKEIERRFDEGVAARRAKQEEQKESEDDLLAYISGKGKKPEKYIKSEIEALTKQLSQYKIELGSIGFCLLGQKASRKRWLKKSIREAEERKANFEILLRTDTIVDAFLMSRSNMHF
jgi:hypothetical protein